MLDFLVAGGFFASLGDLAKVLDAVRAFPATVALALAGRLVVARLAATFFPVDLGPVDLATTAFLPAEVRVRPAGELFLVVDFLGLKGCHPVNLGGLRGMVGKNCKMCQTDYYFTFKETQ